MTADVGDLSPAKKTAHSSIKTLEQFNALYPGYSLDVRDVSLQQVQWVSRPSKFIVIEWLRQVCPEWSLTFTIQDVMENERSLYPLVFEVFKSLLVLSKNLLISPPDMGTSPSALHDAVEAVLSRSRSNSLEAAVTEDATSDEEVNSDDPEVTYDLHSVTDVLSLFLRIEKQIKADAKDGKGFVEFTVFDETSGQPKLLVEVKHSMQSDNNSGLFQLCAELVTTCKQYRARCCYGAYTDAYTWRLVKLDNLTQRFCMTDQVSVFANKINPKLTTDSVKLFSHLFEILDIQEQLDFGSTMEAIHKVKRDLQTKMLSDIRELYGEL
jgi:hypothetical protein